MTYLIHIIYFGSAYLLRGNCHGKAKRRRNERERRGGGRAVVAAKMGPNPTSVHSARVCMYRPKIIYNKW